MDTNHKKIIVLGAGASMGSKRYPVMSSFHEARTCMPSAENFFYDISKVNKSDNCPAQSINILAFMYEGLNQLITRLWSINKEGFDPEEWKEVNIEEVMTFFEVSSKMLPSGCDEQIMFEKAHEYLLDFLFPTVPMICDGQHCEYLMDVFHHMNKEDTIISYNWDTIADFSLEFVNAPQFNNYVNYLKRGDGKQENIHTEGLLLKLHGSFNWMICHQSDCIYNGKIIPPVNSNNNLLKLQDTFKCQHCGSDNLEKFIVPPVSNKMIHENSFLRNQWILAREKLLSVDELIFIGYSFPPTDYYSEWLFRQLRMIDDCNDISIKVVNPDYGKRNSNVTKKYNKLFKGFNIEGFSTLKDYVNKQQ